MTFTFKPAKRENAPVLVMLAGPSGGGKTMSALRLATGLAGGGKIAMIDTEAGRGTHYATQFKFDHGDMLPPFSPEHYVEGIDAADKAGYSVIVIDSMSHCWAGDGGVLDMQEKELERMAGNDWAKRERVKMAAWIKPKMQHKKMMSRLLQCRAHIIMAFRAEEKVEVRKGSDGKQQIVPIGWQPICEKNMPYEATVSFLLSDTKAHLATPIKLQSQHAPFFPLNKPIDEECGKQLAAWAAGGVATEQPKQPDTPPAQTQTNGHAEAPSATDFVLGLPMAWPAPTADRKAWNVACIAAAKEIDALPDAFHAERWEELNGESLQVLLSGANKDFYDRLMGKLMPKKEAQS